MSAVIIQSLKDVPALTEDSIIFRSDRVALAKVSGALAARFNLIIMGDLSWQSLNLLLFHMVLCSVFQVFEVFGPVSSPLYILRFGSTDQIRNKGVTEGDTVYYAPDFKEYTGYILVQQLQL